MTNQQLKAHCEYVIANPQDHLDWVVDMARVALVALTQPSSPALRLPDGWVAVPVEPNWEMLSADGCNEHHNGQACQHHDNRRRIWAAMLAAAPIGPKCATGGAEREKQGPAASEIITEGMKFSSAIVELVGDSNEISSYRCLIHGYTRKVSTQEQAYADAKAACELFSRPAPTADRVPEGWKLVPVEITQEMVDANFEGVCIGGIQAGYRAMLAAAPAPKS